MLRPFFTYFGGKWRAAPKYPPPIYDTIIEPFAGSAGYSLRYPDRKILLVEKSHAIAGIWRYLIGASEREVLDLPLLDRGQSVDTLNVCQEARWLIGMWCGKGFDYPRKILSAWHGKPRTASHWDSAVRDRFARQLGAIRHWNVICDDYSASPSAVATWFIDPPYRSLPGYYSHGTELLDYEQLGSWCRGRNGQVMVCEAEREIWLPFRRFGSFRANGNGNHTRSRSTEALWVNGWPGSALWLASEEAL